MDYVVYEISFLVYKGGILSFYHKELTEEVLIRVRNIF